MARGKEVDVKRRQEQIEEVFQYLRKTGQVHTKKEFSAAIGCSNTNLSQAFSGNKTYLTDNLFVYKIGGAFPEFNFEWLLTGEGEMIKPSSNIQTMSSSGGISVQAQGNSSVLLPGESLTEIETELVRLKAENETLRKENDWLRDMVSKLTLK